VGPKPLNNNELVFVVCCHQGGNPSSGSWSLAGAAIL